MTTIQLEFETQVASHSENMPLNRFDQFNKAGTIVLRPAFQRNFVWNPTQREFLVDTILRGLPIPEVYVQEVIGPDGSEETVVVDGQQRITTCLLFLGDRLRLSSDEGFDARWRGCTFSDLQPELQARFRTYQLVVRKLPPQLEESALREIFRRLNKTVEALNTQELRHAAYTGDFVKLVESAAAYPTLRDTNAFSSKDLLRRKNDEFIAEVMYAISSEAFPNKKDGLENLFITYEKAGMSADDRDRLSRRLGRSFSQLDVIGQRLRRTRFSNKSDLYSLLVLLARSAERLPLKAEDSDALSDMLRDFSDRVNDIKREEAAGRVINDLATDSLGEHALKYLRAVERAASDRLNRVKRNEALEAVLGPLIARGEVRELSSADSDWEEAEEDIDDDELEGTESDDEAEREAAMQLMIERDDPSPLLFSGDSQKI
jgi:hypothetical protein